MTPSSRPLATDRATGGCPWKQAFLDFDAFGFGFVFGQANPGHFRVCVGDAWDHAGVERCGSQLFGHTRIVAQTEFLLIVPRQLGIALAQQENVKVLEPPMLLPSYKVKQHWHERYNQDTGNFWLRKTMASLFFWRFFSSYLACSQRINCLSYYKINSNLLKKTE